MICQPLGHLLGPGSWVLDLVPRFNLVFMHLDLPRSRDSGPGLQTCSNKFFCLNNNLQNQSIDITISASGGNDYDTMRHNALFFEKLKKNNKFENRDKKLASLKNPVYCKKDSLFCSSVLYVLDRIRKLLKKVSLIRNSPSLNFNPK